MNTRYRKGGMGPELLVVMTCILNSNVFQHLPM